MENTDFLKGYEVEVKGKDMLLPYGEYVDFCHNLSDDHKSKIYDETLNLKNAEELMFKNAEVYIDSLSKSIVAFARLLNDGALDENDFPIKDWKFLADSEETRFGLPSFGYLFAKTIESMENKNMNVYIYTLSGLPAKDVSDVVSHLSSVKNVVSFIKDLKAINPDVLNKSSFNPLTDMFHNGQYQMLDKSLEHEDINELVDNRTIKDFTGVSVSTNLLRRLASPYDLTNKVNIARGISVLNDYGLLPTIPNVIDDNEKIKRSSIVGLESDKYLSYYDIYLYAKNNVAIFGNNNKRLVDMNRDYQEKLSYDPIPVRKKRNTI